MPLENLDQSLRLARGGHGRQGRNWWSFKSYPLPPRSGLFQGLHEIVDGFHLANGLGRQAHAKRALNPQEQLGSAQAVDSEIALDPARRGDVDESEPLRMQLTHKLRNDPDQVTFASLLLGHRGRRICLTSRPRH